MQKIALLGCGRVAEHIAQFFEKGIDGASVLLTCDPVKEKADTMAERLGAKPVYDIEDVLKDSEVDLVYIMTESGKHAEHARSALEAGKHVISEKPIGLIPAEVLENQEIADERELMYAGIKQNRLNPALVHLKKTFDDSRFGKIVLASVRLIWCRYQDYYNDEWHGTWSMDGGVINQQAIHHIDALQWICGPVKEVVAAQTNALNDLEAEDTTAAVVKFENGSIGTIQATTAARPEDKEASIIIVGENGTAEVGGIALNEIIDWHFMDKQADDENVFEEYSQVVPTGYGLSHGPLLQEIIDRLNQGDIKPPISAQEALDSVRIVHALYKSAEEHQWIKVDEQVLSHDLGKKS